MALRNHSEKRIIMSDELNKLTVPELAYTLIHDEFNIAFEFESYPRAEDLPVETIKLRHRLIAEEMQEYHDATSDVDRLDALIDLLYVVIGTSVVCEIVPQAYTSGQVYRPGSKRLELIEAHISPLLLELETLCPCTRLMRANLQDAINRILDVCKIYGFDAKGAFMAVHKNNMEKLWRDDQIPTLQQDPQIIVAFKGTGWLVKRLDGKVLKPPTHTKVDLHPYLPWVPEVKE